MEPWLAPNAYRGERNSGSFCESRAVVTAREASNAIINACNLQQGWVGTMQPSLQSVSCSVSHVGQIDDLQIIQNIYR